MDTKLEWLHPRRILYAVRSGTESLTALTTFAEEVIHHLEEGQPPLHLIWHMSNLDVTGVDQRQAMTILNRIMKHPHLHWFVVVDPGMSPLRRFLASALLRLSGIHWRTVDSVADGQAFLQRVDKSLNQ